MQILPRGGNGMYGISKMNSSGNQALKRLIALGFLLCLLVVSTLSTAFIITHMEHEHDHHGVHGDCLVCAQLQSAVKLLKLLSTAFICVGAAFAPSVSLIALAGCIVSITSYLTPVQLKVRMNN